jgi:hypothetical protein
MSDMVRKLEIAQDALTVIQYQNYHYKISISRGTCPVSIIEMATQLDRCYAIIH